MIDAMTSIFRIFCHIALLVILLTPGIVATLPDPAAAAEESSQAAAVAAEEIDLEALLGDDDNYVYQWQGRPDPFMPFISEKVIKAERAKAEEELTGMQKFEPGQLTLVAIVFVGDTPMAMVQDSVGMGYLLREGTKIGRAGVVEAILPNTVLIKEKVQTTMGETRYKTVEMLLKKEGEK